METFHRMSSRERRLVFSLLAVVVVGVFGVGYAILEKETVALEETLTEGRDAMDEIRERAHEYLESQRKKEAIAEAIRENDPLIQTVINEIAKNAEGFALKGNEPVETSFHKVLQYNAKSREMEVFLGGGEDREKGESSDFLELAQQAEFKWVRLLDLLHFLEQVEGPETLMFVSQLDIGRKSNLPEYVTGELTVSTFVHKEEKEEEGD